MRVKRGMNLIAITLVIILAVIGFSVLFDKAWPAHGMEATPTNAQTRAEPQVRSRPASLPRCSGRSKACAQRYAKRFRHGKLGNSKGRKFTKHVRRLVKRYERHHPRVSARPVPDGFFHDWWKFAWSSRYCQMATLGLSFATCLSYGKHYSKFYKATFRVEVKCGGAAILGAFTGAKGKVGWWGAGVGGLTCLYGELFDQAW
jgi:hypothetical protein